MKRHLAYFSYVIRHKWFVLIAGIMTRAPIWRLLIHDWSKFLPSEWLPYARNFYNPDGSKRPYSENKAFKVAWNHHQKRNKHHWQYWVLQNDSGEVDLLPVPEKYKREMVADWMGAGRAITGRWEVKEWYLNNRDKIMLTTGSRLKIELMINIVHRHLLQMDNQPKG